MDFSEIAANSFHTLPPSACSHADHRAQLEVHIPTDSYSRLGFQTKCRSHYPDLDTRTSAYQDDQPYDNCHMRSMSSACTAAAAVGNGPPTQTLNHFTNTVFENVPTYNCYNSPNHIPPGVSANAMFMSGAGRYRSGSKNECDYLDPYPAAPHALSPNLASASATAAFAFHGHHPPYVNPQHQQPHSNLFPSMNINVSMKMNLGLHSSRHYEIEPYDCPYDTSSMNHHHLPIASHYGNRYPESTDCRNSNAVAVTLPIPPMPIETMHLSRSPPPPVSPPYVNKLFLTDNNRSPHLLKSQFLGNNGRHSNGPPLFTYWSSSEFRFWRRDHPSEKPNLCRVCGKTYARPSTLKTHMRTHSGERPYRCTTCQKTFSQAANLTAHMRTHSGEKPFHCQVCDRRFSQSSSVTTHMRTHSGERPYHCRMCKKAFSDSSTLTKHMRVHSGEKPYQCKMCLLRFSQSGNLNRHMRVHTTNANQNTGIP